MLLENYVLNFEKNKLGFKKNFGKNSRSNQLPKLILYVILSVMMLDFF